MQKIIPIIVSTWAALEAAAAEGCPVIYVEDRLYRAKAAGIRELMGSYGYVLSWKRGRQGVFFLLALGEKRFDHSRQEIYDPMDIL